MCLCYLLIVVEAQVTSSDEGLDLSRKKGDQERVDGTAS